MNSIILLGRLTKAPELRYTATGKAVTTFNLAVNRTFSKSDEADFFNIVTWQKTAESCANYLDKGSKVAIQGRLQSRSYENKEGNRVFVVEVVANEVEFLDSKKRKQEEPKNEPPIQGQDEQAEVDLSEFQAIDDDEDLGNECPF